MKTIKVAEATELQLDWLVAYAEGRKCSVVQSSIGLTPFVVLYTDPLGMFTPSTSWAQGGQIIDREITKVFRNVGGTWSAMILKDVPIPPEDRGTSLALTRRAQWNGAGPTALIAAIRCFVTSKLGDTVEVPAELN